jgi:hypothetical protein
MSEAQTLSYSKTLTASRLRTYQVLFVISILGNLVVGFWCIFDPVGFARLLLQPDPFLEPWPRVWGATLIGLHLVYVPGLRNSLFYRWPNWSSIAIKFFMTIIFLSSGRISIHSHSGISASVSFCWWLTIGLCWRKCSASPEASLVLSKHRTFRGA